MPRIDSETLGKVPQPKFLICVPVEPLYSSPDQNDIQYFICTRMIGRYGNKKNHASLFENISESVAAFVTGYNLKNSPTCVITLP